MIVWLCPVQLLMAVAIADSTANTLLYIAMRHKALAHVKSEDENNDSEVVPKTILSSPSKKPKLTPLNNGNNDVDQRRRSRRASETIRKAVAVHHLYLATPKSLHIESENKDNLSEIVPKTTASSPSKTAKITSIDNENNDVDKLRKPLKSLYDSGN